MIQRVKRASVSVGGEEIAAIGRGYLTLVGIEVSDGPQDARLCAAKLAGLRVFRDEADKMNLALADVDGEALVVSQFTLLGDISGGRRPSFIRAARPEQAQPLFGALIEELSRLGVQAKTGVFGADMDIELVNEGPVTILFDSRRPALC